MIKTCIIGKKTNQCNDEKKKNKETNKRRQYTDINDKNHIHAMQ
jgi:hypothetical protein